MQSSSARDQEIRRSKFRKGDRSHVSWREQSHARQLFVSSYFNGGRLTYVVWPDIYAALGVNASGATKLQKDARDRPERYRGIHLHRSRLIGKAEPKTLQDER